MVEQRTQFKGAPPVPAAAARGLTARQAELLQFCIERGYYEIPRRANLRQLSAELGISFTSLSIALRRAEAKAMAAQAADGVVFPARPR